MGPVRAAFSNETSWLGRIWSVDNEQLLGQTGVVTRSGNTGQGASNARNWGLAPLSEYLYLSAGTEILVTVQRTDNEPDSGYIHIISAMSITDYLYPFVSMQENDFILGETSDYPDNMFFDQYNTLAISPTFIMS